MARLKFGAFLAPHHPIGENPLLQFRRDLDFVEQIGPSIWKSFQGNPGIRTVASPSWQNLLAQLNAKSLSLPVRQAILYAIDYPGVIAALQGAAYPSSGLVPAGLLGHSTPVFWFGMMGLLVFYAWLGWAGGAGRVDLAFDGLVAPRSGLLAADKAGFVNLHSGAGVGNALGNVYTAHRNQTPLVITAGQQARSILPLQAFLYAERASEFPRPYVKYSVEPARAEDVPAAIARAYYVAMQPPCGPTFVSVPIDDWARPTQPVEARQVSRELEMIARELKRRKLD